MSFNVKKIIEDLSFDNELFEDVAKNKDIFNPYAVELLIRECDAEKIQCDALKNALKEHKIQETCISQDDIKSVFLKLKNREKNPRGYFDKQGRFYARDHELMDVRSPSCNHPYSQMNAARTAKFVKSLVEKYKTQTLKELEEVAFS